MSLVIVGSIVAPGADRTGITCHVFVDGGQIASVGRAGAGPVTVATGTATNIRLGPFQVCAEAFAEYPGGARWEKRC